MELLRDFTKLGKEDVVLAGGKGASLGEMTRAGIPVPSGFVILSGAFEKFLEETDLNVEIDAALDSVNHKEIHTVENASEKIQALILGAGMSKDIGNGIQKFFKQLGTKYVAVRSSATAEDSASAAWAGQLESYLNTTEENLLENVKKCWASLFTPRAIFYRFEKDLHKQKISVAVVVQKMVESEKSGIAFSVHPVTQDRNQLIIEAGLGLGEAIVSGQITPDSYVVEKQPRRIIDKNIQVQTKGLYRAKNGGNEWRDIPKTQREKQVLSDKEIEELSETIFRIENHYDFPCDIEWAKENGKFYIVQSRPITTLSTSRFENIPPAYWDNSKNWIHYLTRSFTLFGASLWHLWYYSQQTRELFNADMPDVLFIEEHTGVVRHYRVKEQLEAFKKAVKKIVAEDQKRSLEILKKGQAMNSQAEEYLKLGPNAFQNLKSAVDFLIGIALHATIFPYWAYTFLDELKIENKELESISEKLRGTSYYPKLVTSIVTPLAKMELQKYTDQNNNALDSLTISELLNGEIQEINDRLKRTKEKQHFIYQSLGEEELIVWVNEVTELVMQLEDIPEISLKSGLKQLKGQAAYLGKAKGVARIILTPDGKGAHFDEGDVLVSINSNPNLMPLLQKCSAIVTDEGGITCHAAIVSRELKKPCVMGTRIATSIIKDGDIVEVDSHNQTVTIIQFQ